MAMKSFSFSINLQSSTCIYRNAQRSNKLSVMNGIILEKFFRLIRGEFSGDSQSCVGVPWFSVYHINIRLTIL